MFKPSHSTSTQVSTLLRSAISRSSSRMILLALIFAVTIAITLGLLAVQSLLSESNSATFNVLRIVLFAHIGMAGIYVMVSALWDILERRLAIKESRIGQGEVAAAEGGDDGEQELSSLPASNLQVSVVYHYHDIARICSLFLSGIIKYGIPTIGEWYAGVKEVMLIFIAGTLAHLYPAPVPKNVQR
ncbi:uncharacterized protein EV420DRAFT_1135116 [Desarmillaria tabescens]|uniref:Uncharacterized protein n=1 Tax=Armillaria tabescens TaxID=1929756 RepID=A0AA39JD58_ARMTA|nr:uncharacterized protein EV420DRAFT_1135116 [Desarmillaria tabescens]KAK0440438.1 hypothetical protein EV420DRAFT_1135116 [Desarmillaria tabescens]